MVEGSRDQDLRSATDKALREMMQAAADLPVPDRLRALVESLQASDEADPTES